VLPAEAQALKQKLGVQSCDCYYLEVVTTMLHGAQSHGIAAAIFDDCYRLSMEFVKIQFECSPCEMNYVADELARLANGSIQNVWI
jgi:hypothetical protein